MKTLNLIKLTVVAGSLLTLTARAGIEGTPHDFSSQSWNTDPSDPATVCGTCHVPHHADSTVVPLWGHQSTATAFTMFNNANVPSATLPGLLVQSAQPNGPSKACLSCHDGTVAINSYGGVGNYTTHGPATYITNSAMVAVNHTDLTGTHPISLIYDDSIVGTAPGQDQWLYNPNTTPVLTPVSGPFVPGNDMTINGFLLNGNNTLECTSCHDVHNQNGTPFDIVNNPKLVKIVGVDGSGHGSLLCRSCHNK